MPDHRAIDARDGRKRMKWLRRYVKAFDWKPDFGSAFSFVMGSVVGAYAYGGWSAAGNMAISGLILLAVLVVIGIAWLAVHVEQ